MNAQKLEISLEYIRTKGGFVYSRRAWTGGDAAPANFRRENKTYRRLVSAFFRESLSECGGLDLWKAAGTGSMERARIFWDRAKLDAWATYKATKRV